MSERFTPEDQAFLAELGKETSSAFDEQEKIKAKNNDFLEHYDEMLESKLFQNDLTVEQHLAMLENSLDSWIKRNPKSGKAEMIEFIRAMAEREDTGPAKKEAIKEFLSKVEAE